MTPAEVNAEIARLRGDVTIISSPDDVRGFSLDGKPNGDVTLSVEIAGEQCVPDYCGEWAFAGPLLEEVIGSVQIQSMNAGIDGRRRWCFYFDGYPHGALHDGGYHVGGADSLPECIARAYLAWKRAS